MLHTIYIYSFCLEFLLNEIPFLLCHLGVIKIKLFLQPIRPVFLILNSKLLDLPPLTLSQRTLGKIHRTVSDKGLAKNPLLKG